MSAAQLTLELPDSTARHSLRAAPGSAFWWQWHGRQAFMEVRNDFRFPRKLHRVVYHLCDACKAPDEATARAMFHSQYPEAQETGFSCVGPVKEPKRRNTPNHDV